MTEQLGEFLFAHPLDEVVGPFGQTGVHAHVQSAISSDAKSALCRIELVRAHPKVCQDAIDLLHAMKAQEVGGEPEVLWNQGEPVVLGDIGFGIRIAVKAKQAAVGTQGF